MKRPRAARDRSSFVSESLEPRALLAAVAWDGEAGDRDWHNPLNWDGDVVPAAGDDVAIGEGSTVEIGAIGQAAAQSLDLAGSLTIEGTLEVSDEVFIRAAASFEVSAAGHADVGRLAIDPGSTQVTVAGEIAIADSALIASDVVVSGLLTIEGQVVWTGGQIDVQGPEARVTIEAGAALRARFAPDTGQQLIGSGTLEVEGTFEAIWAGPGSADQRLIVRTLLDNQGTVRVKNGTLSLFGRIEQTESLGGDPEEMFALTGGVWEARRNGTLWGTQHVASSATALIGPNGSMRLLGFYHPVRYPEDYIELHNTGTITVVGGGSTLTGRARMVLYNEGTIRKIGNARRIHEGAILNESGGLVEVLQGRLDLYSGVDFTTFRNEGTLVLGDLTPGGTAARLNFIEGGFVQPAGGTVMFLAAYDGERFRMGSIRAREGGVSIAGALSVQAVGTPIGTQTFRWLIASFLYPGTGINPTTTLDIQGRTGELLVEPGRAIVVAAP